MTNRKPDAREPYPFVVDAWRPLMAALADPPRYVQTMRTPCRTRAEAEKIAEGARACGKWSRVEVLPSNLLSPSLPPRAAGGGK